MNGPSIADLAAEAYPGPPPWTAEGFDVAQVMRGTRVLPVQLGRFIDPGDLARGADGRVWRYEAGRYLPDDGVIADRVVRLMGDDYTTRLPQLARDRVTRREGFPQLTDAAPDPRVVNVRNGMVEVETGHLWPHSPAWRSTVQLPVTYSPGARCPRFDAWLREVVPEGVIPLVWEVIGYAVVSGNPLQRAALLIGRPGSGKGTLLRVIERLLGAENIAAVTVPGMSTAFEPAELYGKLANIVADAEASYLPDTAAFKRIVAGDRISAQRKYGQPFAFAPWAFHLFAMNAMPGTGDASGGWTRRWELVPFRDDVATDHAFREDRLHAEVDGILVKALQAVRPVLRSGSFTRSPESMRPALELAQASDIVRVWLADDEAILQQDPGDHTAAASRRLAYTAYTTWASASGHRHPLTRQAFTQRLTELGYEERKVRGDRQWRGLRIDPALAQQRWGALQ